MKNRHVERDTMIGAIKAYNALRDPNDDYDWSHDTRANSVFSTGELTVNERCFIKSNDEQPVASIIIPYDIVREPPQNLVRTLGALTQPCQDIGPTEVTIWSNAKVGSIRDDRDTCERFNDVLYNWEDLCDSFERRYKDYDGLQLRIPHSFFSRTQNLNDIRSRFMEAVCWNGAMRGFPMSHPVVWLDADTTFVGRHAIEKLIRPLRHREAHFTHANLSFTSAGNVYVPWAERSDAEKTAAVYSLVRRLIERNLAPSDDRGYVEESGLACTIDAFLGSAGIGVNDPNIGESRGLLTRARKLLDPSIPLLAYISDAPIGTSDRRFVQLARTAPPICLPRSEAGDDYVEYLSMKPQRHSDSLLPLTRALLDEMVVFMDDRQESRTGHRLTATQHDYLRQTISRLGIT